jgi:hypothetical protein
MSGDVSERERKPRSVITPPARSKLCAVIGDELLLMSEDGLRGGASTWLTILAAQRQKN